MNNGKAENSPSRTEYSPVYTGTLYSVGGKRTESECNTADQLVQATNIDSSECPNVSY